MLKKRHEIQHELILSTLDELVPQNHLVRKLDEIDYSFIYDEVSECYSEEGRPSIDPIILFKILLIKNVFKIKSIRKTIKEIEVNLAYRWFLNIPLSEKVPHYSVISNNFNKRFTKFILNNIFNQIMSQAYEKHILNDKNMNFTPVKYKIKKQKNKVDERSLYDTTLV